MRLRRHRWTTATAAIGLCIVAGCGSGKDSIVVTGSSTVEPIAIAVSEKFATNNSDAQIVVDGPGTGDGFLLFCQGDADVNNASSKIKPEQVDECADNGIEFIELHIGNDGIAVMTNPANDSVDCVNLADLYALTGPESQGVNSWSAAQRLASQLGSATVLPDVALDVVGPGEESGTFVSYVELVIEHFADERGQDATTRPDYQSSADDNVIITGLQGSSTGLGWVGYAFAREATGVKILGVADGAGEDCVVPTDDSIADGTYAIARPLFIYVNKQRAEANPALASWVDYFLSDEGSDAVSEVGYVALPADQLELTRQVWQQRETGPQEVEP